MPRPSEFPTFDFPASPAVSEEEKLAILREALAQGEASPDAEGDIFEQIADEFGLTLRPRTEHRATEEQRLALLDEALTRGEASPLVDGDIFDIVRKKYSLPRDDS